MPQGDQNGDKDRHYHQKHADDHDLRAAIPPVGGVVRRLVVVAARLVELIAGGRSRDVIVDIRPGQRRRVT
jgi:hypothetical protein